MNSFSTDIKDIRKFGIAAFFFFGFLAALSFWRQVNGFGLFFGFLSLTGMGFILFPAFSRPVYRAWLKAAYFVNRIITLLLLTLAYSLVITPAAFIKRIFGGHPLPLKPDPSARSYWIPRSEPMQPKERFTKRY